MKRENNFSLFIKEIYFIILFLGIIFAKGFAQSGFVSIGAEIGSFSDQSTPYVTYTYGQLFGIFVDSNANYTPGVQQPYLIEVTINDTVCQEADSTMRYQQYDFDLPLHSAGTLQDDRYFPIGSYHNYDTVTFLQLVIHPIYFVTDTFLVYDAQMPYVYNDSIILNTEGTHTLVLPTMHGCDSTVDVMLYVATCPPDTQFIAAYSICDYPNLPLHAPSVVPAPIPMNNNAPAAFVVGDTTHVLWMISVAGQSLSCSQYVYIAFPPCGEDFYAYDGNGNQYNTVRVGCDCWTKENSFATHYTDGTQAPGTYVYYASLYPDTAQNLATYGRLYDWFTALGLPHGYSGPISDTIQGICPEGWHIPTSQQFTNLIAFPADHLKSPDLWIMPGTNETDFTALPGGYYNTLSNQFYNLRGNAYFWTSAGGDSPHGEYYQITYSCENGYPEPTPKDYAYSVRCVKN